MNRVALFPVLLAVSCASANGLDGRSALVNVASEPPGSACEFGGVKIQSGLDANSNGSLDLDEVEDTQYACNGGESDATLTRASEEPVGENCEFGGVRVDLGGDVDENGSLGDDEVEDTEYVCNGADGANGLDGRNGTDGTNGSDGTDGQSYLTDVTAVPANGACGAETGVRIEAGHDTNNNGALDAGEADSSEVVCNGADGVDGVDGTGGGGSSRIASAYVEGEVRSNAAPVTLVSVTINAPAAGTVAVFGVADAYCSSSAAPQCLGTGPTPAYTRIVNTASGDPTSGAGHGYVHLNANITENVQRANTFTVPSAGSYTYYLRGEAQIATVGFWRSHITAVWVSN